MRISGGKARGVTLEAPRGDLVRPATEGMRQALFSSLASWLPGATFADLFAGSGSYGFEAWSRGAVAGWAVEKSPKAQAGWRANRARVAKSLGADEASVQLVPVDVLTWAGPPAARCDLVFIDPPYEQIPSLAPLLFAKLEGWLASSPEALVVFEMPAELSLTPAGWRERKRLGRGGSGQPTVVLYQREPRAP